MKSDTLCRSHHTRYAAICNVNLCVSLPNAFIAKYPQASQEWGWQWAFPASKHYTHPETGEQYRHHLHESVIQKAVKEAARQA